MSKLEILKNSPTPADLRESVQQLSKLMQSTSEKLESTVAQIRSLEQLPDLVAEQVTQSLKALTPVLEMRQELQTTLDSVDTIAAVQRTTLEELGKELASKATLNMESKTKVLDGTLNTLAIQVQGLKSSLSAMEKSSKGLQALPETLSTSATDAAEQIRSEARALTKAAQDVSPSPWVVLSQMAGAALLAALLVVAGQAVSSRILPPSETQRNADNFLRIWGNATPKERESIQQIANRPVK